MESKVQQIVDVKKPKTNEEQNPMFNRVFREIKLSEFTNYEELSGAAHEMDDEQMAENVEMTEQEIEALQTTLNDQECKVIKVDEGAEELAANFPGISKEELDQLDIKFLISLSIVPKYEQDQYRFKILDTVMNNQINLMALPAIEMVLALPSSYPSKQRPLFLQRTRFYEDFGKYEEFMLEQVNLRWSEDMPVLYDIAIFLQDEFME